MIRDGSHTAVRRHRLKLEKEKKHKVWVAAQRKRIATDSAEVACAAEMDTARERYDVDAKKTNTNVVRYANDSRGSSFSNNAYVRPGSDVLRAGSRGIPANREVFWSYGSDYWKGTP